jgi:hypothetical protein
MSFRGKRDDWDDFLKAHGATLRACGIPDCVFSKKMRFLVFLDHGFDEWGLEENSHSFFDSRVLTDEQIGILAEFVATHIDQRYRVMINSRWLRAW